MNSTTSQFVPQPGDRVLFVTGRLAEGVVRRVVSEVSELLGFAADVHVVGISVAALMHVDWLIRKLDTDLTGYDQVFVPGWCRGDLRSLTEKFSKPFSRGPKEIHDLAEFFGQANKQQPNLDSYDVEILAEINHAPRLSVEEILAAAESYRSDGADLIDLGCIPGETWTSVGDVVQEMCAANFRVSIDSFDHKEVELAIAAGAELILSCNSRNVSQIASLGVEAVVIPDDPNELSTMWQTADELDRHDCPFRLDPILEPIGFGFANSLARYYEVRRKASEIPIMMGIGNVTEMSEVDSAGVNFVLAAICQELEIHSVLTTEVIPWCQGAVKEFDVARRMVKHAVDNHTLAKRVCSDLVMLRDTHHTTLGRDELTKLSQSLRDPNFRIFVEGETIHVMNRDGYWTGDDPFEMFEEMIKSSPGIDPSHAFYLGYEFSKAVTALTLGKRYRQDQALHWGFLTIPEQSHLERKRKFRSGKGSENE